MVCDAKYHSDMRLDGKTAVVTGSNTGIGKVTIKHLYKRGARAIMACRTVEKAEEAAAEIRKECEGEENLGTIVVVKLDLTSLESVRSCAKSLINNEKQINLLINNAGIMMCPEGKTEDGYETQFGTNHLGHFLFTLLLLPTIVKSVPARIVSVSSVGHTLLSGPLNLDDLNWEKRPYSSTQAYFASKLANILFTKELTRRIQDANIEGVTTYSLHPGAIATDLARHTDETLFRGMGWMNRNILKHFFKTPEQGAQTTLHCALNENAGKETGLYYAECKVKEPSAKAKNMEDAKKLWDLSIKMAGLAENYNPFQQSAQS